MDESRVRSDRRSVVRCGWHGRGQGFESPKLHQQHPQARRHFRSLTCFGFVGPVGEIWENRSPPTTLAASPAASSWAFSMVFLITGTQARSFCRSSCYRARTEPTQRSSSADET
jgi:hypothetical protein